MPITNNYQQLQALFGPGVTVYLGFANPSNPTILTGREVLVGDFFPGSNIPVPLGVPKRFDDAGQKNINTYLTNYDNEWKKTYGYDNKVNLTNRYADLFTWMYAFPDKAKLVYPGSAYENAILNPASSVENFRIAYPGATEAQAQQIVDAYAKANDKGSFWTQARDFVEGGLVVLGNYLAPGSASLTTGLTSTGAQDLLATDLGQAITTISGVSGGAAGNLSPAQLIGNSRIVSSLTGTVGQAVQNITGSTVVADIATGAFKGGIVGTTLGGISAIAGGRNVGEGMYSGLEYGAASGAIRGWNVGGKLEPYVGDRASQGIQAGLEEFAGQEATGSSLRESLLEGGTVGLATGLFPTKEGATAGQQAFTAAERELAKQLIGGYLAERYGDTGATGSTVPSSAPPPGATPSGVTYGQGQQPSPGSAALAQALRVGDAGAPIFGSSEEKGKAPSGWNVESLRYMG